MDIESLFLFTGMSGIFSAAVFIFYGGIALETFIKNEYDIFTKTVFISIVLIAPFGLTFAIFDTLNPYAIAGFILWTGIFLLSGVWNPIFRHLKNDKNDKKE